MKFNNLVASSLSVIMFYGAAFPWNSFAQQPEQMNNSFYARAESEPPAIVATGASRAQSSGCCTQPLNPGDIVAGVIPAPAVDNCLLGDTQYKIEFPGGARKLVIDLSMSQSVSQIVHVYVRHGSPIAVENGRTQYDFSIFRFISSRRVERFSFPSVGRFNIFDPGIPLLQPGSYFIAVDNCGKDATSYTLSAKILDPPDQESITLSSESVEVGSVPAPEPGFCRIGRTQYFVNTFFAPCGGDTSWYLLVRGDHNVNLYVRKGMPVTEENHIVMYDGLTTSQGKYHEIFVGSSTPGQSVFFIAIENCGVDAVNYTITPALLQGDPTPHFIERVFFENKDLHIVGFGIQGDAVFFDDQPQQATFGGTDSNFRDIIIIKKAKKMIARHQTIGITTKRSGSACSTPPFIFTRP